MLGAEFAHNNSWYITFQSDMDAQQVCFSKNNLFLFILTIALKVQLSFLYVCLVQLEYTCVSFLFPYYSLLWPLHVQDFILILDKHDPHFVKYNI